MQGFIMQLGREPLQRTNMEEIKELLRAAKREQDRREETAHSRRQSQSSPHKGAARSEHSSSSLDFDFSLQDHVSFLCTLCSHETHILQWPGHDRTEEQFACLSVLEISLLFATSKDL